MKKHYEREMFFDGDVGIARYDVVRYPQFEKLTEKQLGFFWRPQEVLLDRDNRDFKILSDHEKHIFTSNLKRQILLDSVQGRAPSITLAPICSLPEVESFIMAWTFFEQIHSRSYTHILRNVYSDPSIVFDTLMDIPEIVACSSDINKYYDTLYEYNKTGGSCGTYIGDFNHRKALWLALHAINALEGLRFYVSFACSWSFAELNKMEGNAKIIKFIARDENIHLAFTQQVIKLLLKENKIWKEIEEECRYEVQQIFMDVVNQEKEWAKYLFKDGSIIGLNEQLLTDYLEWLANKRMTAIGIWNDFEGGSNPLPWTQKWIAGGDIQVAPQETSISSYVVGAVKQDLNDDFLKGLQL